MISKTRKRKLIFTGRYAYRERIAFRDFLKRFYPNELKKIEAFIAELVFEDEKNIRTSKILQRAFIKFCEENIKEEDEITKKVIMNYLKIRGVKKLSELIDNLKESLK